MPTVRNLFLRDLLLHRLGNGVPPETVQFCYRPLQFRPRDFDGQVRAADHAQSARAHFHDPRALQHFDGVRWSDGNDNAALGFAEKKGVQPRAGEGGQINLRADQRGVSRAICREMQLSARATARPPSLQSCALFTRPE